jgi:site-specific DNA-methyltransferase (adenine-specific)
MPLPRKEILADGIELWCADFREVLPYAVDDFHHLITDAPFEQISHDSTGSIRRTDGQKNPEAIPFAGIDDMRDDLLIRARLKCMGWFLCFCTTEGVAIWRDAIEKHNLRYKTPMIWVKPDAMPKFNGQGPSHGHECIVSAWCGQGHSRWNGGGRRGTFTHMTNGPDRIPSSDGGHPTQKPLSLMSELITLFSNPGEVICDPFMGSGSTGVACLKTGRRFIGIEMNPVWFEMACRRMNEVLAQPDLFMEAPALAKQGNLPI